MGFFSWNTSDTKRSIPNVCSGRETFTVHMITEDGRVFTETDYQGYGVFGGKDIYELIAELNGLCPNGNREQKRSAAIDLVYKTQITNGEKTYEEGKDFIRWDDLIAGEGGKTPNDLIGEGWTKVYPNGYGDFNEAAKQGIKLPKLVEDNDCDFNDYDYPTNCEFQGYFYEDEDEDEDEDWYEDEDEDEDEDY